MATSTFLASSSTLLTTSTATSTPSASASHSDADSGECRLLGPFAILIQAALGALALLALVYKRWRERPQRPVKVWAFDASKQVVGSMLLHLANLLMSLVSSGALTTVPSADGDGNYHANPCSFYLLNLAIDTTLGIPILIFWLRVFTYGFAKTPFGMPAESIRSGHYGHPPKALWWLKQCLIYFLGLLAMKACVFVLFKMLPWLVRVGDWALGWTEGNEQVQIFFVMLFFPLIMNALQYYVIDTFIKGKGGDEHEAVPGEDPDRGSDELLPPHSGNAWDASFESDDEEEEGLKKARGSERSRLVKPTPSVKVEDREYDPRADGEHNGSSSRQRSSSGGRGRRSE